MYKNVKFVSKENKDLRVDSVKGYNYAKDLTQSIITIDEFYKASRSQPIVFSQNKSGEYAATILLGLTENKNSFLDNDGKWVDAEYIPAYIRKYPFIFVKDKEQLILAYDENCKEVNEKTGKKLFDQDGNESKYLENTMNFLTNYHQSSLKTNLFVKQLDELGLLEDANVSMTVKEKKVTFTGFKKVSEEKLNALTDDQIMQLIKNGSYKLISAHLISLGNFEKLVALEK